MITTIFAREISAGYVISIGLNWASPLAASRFTTVRHLKNTELNNKPIKEDCTVIKYIQYLRLGQMHTYEQINCIGTYSSRKQMYTELNNTEYRWGKPCH